MYLTENKFEASSELELTFVPISSSLVLLEFVLLEGVFTFQSVNVGAPIFKSSIIFS